MKLLPLLESIIQHLYHWTYPANAINILQQNVLGTDDPNFLRSKFPNRTSFTRDRNFAFGFNYGKGVVFVVDGTKLRQQYRVKPTRGQLADAHDEAEEYTNKPILNFSNYIEKMILYSIWIDEKDMVKLKKLAEQRSIPFIVLHDKYAKPISRKYV